VRGRNGESGALRRGLFIAGLMFGTRRTRVSQTSSSSSPASVYPMFGLGVDQSRAYVEDVAEEIVRVMQRAREAFNDFEFGGLALLRGAS